MVQILGICSEPEHFAIILEYLPGGSLHEYLKNQMKPLPLPRVIQLIDGIAAGMLHLVSLPVSLLVSLNEMFDETNRSLSIQKTLSTEIWLPETFFCLLRELQRFLILDSLVQWRMAKEQHEQTLDL